MFTRKISGFVLMWGLTRSSLLRSQIFYVYRPRPPVFRYVPIVRGSGPCARGAWGGERGDHSLGPRDPLSRTLSSAERGKDTSAAGWGAWPAGYGLCSRCSGRVWGTAVWPGSGRVRRRGRARRGYKRPRAPLRVWRARIRVLQNPQGMAICWLAKLYCWLSFSWRSCWFVEHARAHGPRPLRGTTPRRPLPQLGPGTQAAAELPSAARSALGHSCVGRSLPARGPGSPSSSARLPPSSKMYFGSFKCSRTATARRWRSRPPAKP